MPPSSYRPWAVTAGRLQLRRLQNLQIRCPLRFTPPHASLAMKGRTHSVAVSHNPPFRCPLTPTSLESTYAKRTSCLHAPADFRPSNAHSPPHGETEHVACSLDAVFRSVLAQNLRNPSVQPQSPAHSARLTLDRRRSSPVYAACLARTRAQSLRGHAEACIKRANTKLSTKGSFDGRGQHHPLTCSYYVHLEVSAKSPMWFLAQDFHS